MSMESAKKFIKRLQTDDDFLQQVKGCKDFEERNKFVKSEGFDFTAEEINRLKDEFTDDDSRRTVFNEAVAGYDNAGWGWK